MRKISNFLSSLCALVFILSCNATTSTTTTTTTGLKFTVTADFSKAASLVSALSASDCGGTTLPTTSDDPSFAVGVDC